MLAFVSAPFSIESITTKVDIGAKCTNLFSGNVPLLYPLFRRYRSGTLDENGLKQPLFFFQIMVLL